MFWLWESIWLSKESVHPYCRNAWKVTLITHSLVQDLLIALKKYPLVGLSIGWSEPSRRAGFPGDMSEFIVLNMCCLQECRFWERCRMLSRRCNYSCVCYCQGGCDGWLSRARTDGYYMMDPREMIHTKYHLHKPGLDTNFLSKMRRLGEILLLL